MRKSYRLLLLSVVLIVLFFVIPLTAFAESSNKEPIEDLRVVYFYSSKCLSCKENEDYIEKLGKIKGIDMIKYNTDSDDCSAIQYAYASEFGVATTDALTVPYIYLGDVSYKLSPSIHNEVTKKIDDYISGREPFQNFNYDASSCEPSMFEKLMQQMTVAGVLFAGLLDGINPCAISMLMVFFSFLFYSGEKKKTLAMASLFILGIFLANFLFGLGVKTFYNLFAGNTTIIIMLYSIAILMCVAAISLNALDIINRTKGETAKNQLPDRIKFKLSSMMRGAIFSKVAIPAAFGVGFLIGVVELACTGQIYLPTLTYMIASDNERLQSVVLLLLYNLMFILPLIIVTIVAAIVKKPEEVKNTIMQKNHIIKGIAIAFFTVMLIVLIKELIVIF